MMFANGTYELVSAVFPWGGGNLEVEFYEEQRSESRSVYAL